MPPVMKVPSKLSSSTLLAPKKIDHGLIDGLLQLSTDPNFIPDIRNSDSDPENLNEGHTCLVFQPLIWK